MTKIRIVFVVALLAAVCAACEPPATQNSGRPDKRTKPAEARPAVGAGARYALLVLHQVSEPDDGLPAAGPRQ
jgi:hypothetical protein